MVFQINTFLFQILSSYIVGPLLDKVTSIAMLNRHCRFNEEIGGNNIFNKRLLDSVFIHRASTLYYCNGKQKMPKFTFICYNICYCKSLVLLS